MFDRIGLEQIDQELFRHLVLFRIVHPGSKFKTVDYIRCYCGKEVSAVEVYRFLDQIAQHYQNQAEHIVFEHSKAVMGDKFAIVFYDVTTLHFEASDEDDLRQMGYSKDGKHQNPQILVGLLVGTNGLPLAREMFAGNRFEGHTFVPVLEAFTARLSGQNPLVVADAGLLSKDNLEALKPADYVFNLGARPIHEP